MIMFAGSIFSNMQNKAVFSLDGVGVKGAGDGEAVETLHGGDGRGDGVRGAEGVGPHVPRGQVTVLLQP